MRLRANLKFRLCVTPVVKCFCIIDQIKKILVIAQKNVNCSGEWQVMNRKLNELSRSLKNM